MIATPLLHFCFCCFFSSLISSISALNSDGITLLSFKNSLLSHQSSLQNWNYRDPTPCSWSGVTCAPQNGSVISLLLPNSNLLGSISTDFGRLQRLRSLDLSNNSINGTLPTSLFNCSDLQTLSLSSNFISGELPAVISGLKSLRVLNLSDNILVGKLPDSLGSLKNLTSVSLKNNYFSGSVPGGFDSVEVLDLSSNFFNGTLPLDFGGGRLSYLNFSKNKLSGSVFPAFAAKIPANAVVDLSFNKFASQLPQIPLFSNQKTEYFAGNVDLCGKPLKNMCSVPSSLSIPPNVSATAAIAAIPKTAETPSNHGSRKVKPGKIVAIVVGDVAAMVVLTGLFFYAYRFRKKKTNQNPKETVAVKIDKSKQHHNNDLQPEFVHESRSLLVACSCFNCKTGEETSETETISKSEDDHDNRNNHMIGVNHDKKKKECLVMVDGETELEMETLLKASAYILGSSGGSIVYKAVIGGGVAFAVRRIGESRVQKMREFEKIVRFIGKFRHRNLVKVRGFYWGEDERLVIYDYISNGSLAAETAYKAVGSSSCHLSFDARLKIAKGTAKGISYIHEKKHVHGNIKPSNILLTSEMDPVISDFGLKWLTSGKINYTIDKSTQNFGSTRSTSSHEETMITRDHHHPTSKYTYVVPPVSHGCTSSYHAPESMKTLEPNPKWDIYSFGIILLELLSGKAISNKELDQWKMGSSIFNNENQILKIIDDEFITDDVHNRKDSILTCFKLGLHCASLSPQERPSMKEALQVLEKIQCP